jgi:NDP-sugar pyrophosphorylase family protein
MLAVILAGGFGTRLRPLTFTTPKPLLPVANRPLIDHAIDALPPEVDEVVVALGYKADMIEDHFRHHPRRMPVRIAREDTPLGTGGAIQNAVRAAGGTDGTFLVRNADLIDSCDTAALVALHRRARSLATIALWEVEDPSPFGVATLQGERITGFVEKPKKELAPSRMVNAGTYALEPEVLDRIPDTREEFSIERSVFPVLCATQRGMHGLRFAGHWIDCGRVDTYLEAHRILLQGKAALAEGARMQGSTKGFACVGPGAVVEPGAVLEDSVLLAGAHVGRDARLVRTVLGHHARAGRGATLTDAVLGDGAEAAPGAKLMNTKLPEVAA